MDGKSPQQCILMFCKSAICMWAIIAASISWFKLMLFNMYIDYIDDSPSKSRQTVALMALYTTRNKFSLLRRKTRGSCPPKPSLTAAWGPVTNLTNSSNKQGINCKSQTWQHRDTSAAINKELFASLEHWVKK
jgi:hypothetical protein